MRKCARCGEEKLVTEFNWKNQSKGWLNSYCKPCWTEYTHERYEVNKAKYVANTAARNQQRRVERTAFLVEYFKTHPCVDCGEDDPVVLDFDHLRDKEFNIGQDLEYKPWHVVLAEIEKCEVACANCHRRRTAFRNGSLRAAIAWGLEPTV